MTLAAHHTPIPFTRNETGLECAFARLRSLYLRWSTARLNRPLAVELTDRQLADAGLDRAALNGNVSVTEIPVSVMMGLMSMR
jgi:uncharacterized protein YjiS (DUF1127 family)